MTTFFCILYLDMVLFSEHKSAGIIAHKEKDAKKIFKDKVKFAWDNLPQHLQDLLGPPNSDAVGELSFPNGSSIFVSTSTRGGTLQYLHISEFGYTCAHHPIKAQEIVTGSINSVEQGQVVTIESTAEGRSGYYFDFCDKAEKMALSKAILGPMDFKFFFFPWWKNPTYRQSVGPKHFDAKHREYFLELKQKHKIDLDLDQKRWYVSKHSINRDNMFAEYPSTSEEAFHASVEGAYYASEMLKVYAEKRVRLLPVDPTLTVDTWWDLGMNDKNVTIFTQSFGNEIRIVDYYENSGEGLAHYVNMLKDRGYTYGTHTFPHDIKVKELGSGKSRYQTLIDLKMRGIRMVERTRNVSDDIEAVRRLLPRMYFDIERTGKLVEALENYRREWNEKNGEFMNTPRHDKHSHAADALRTLARGWHGHAVSTGDTESDKQKAEATQDFF